MAKEGCCVSKEYYVYCPVCGKMLFRAQDANKIEVQCPKCRQGLIIKYYAGVLQLSEYHAARGENKG